MMNPIPAFLSPKLSPRPDSGQQLLRPNIGGKSHGGKFYRLLVDLAAVAQQQSPHEGGEGEK